MNHEYKSLREIKDMIDKLAGFNDEQLKLIRRIAESSYECGKFVNQQKSEVKK